MAAAAAVLSNPVSCWRDALFKTSTQRNRKRFGSVTAVCAPPQSAVQRVGRLPLVSSACGLLASVYSGTKHTHRYLRSLCEAAELGLRSLGSAALTTASPLIHRLEPQSECSPPGPEPAASEPLTCRARVRTFRADLVFSFCCSCRGQRAGL